MINDEAQSYPDVKWLKFQPWNIIQSEHKISFNVTMGCFIKFSFFCCCLSILIVNYTSSGSKETFQKKRITLAEFLYQRLHRLGINKNRKQVWKRIAWWITENFFFLSSDGKRIKRRLLGFKIKLVICCKIVTPIPTWQFYAIISNKLRPRPTLYRNLTRSLLALKPQIARETMKTIMWGLVK